MTAEKTLTFAYAMRKSVESRFEENGGVLPTEPEKLAKVRAELIPVLYPEYRNILDMIAECETEIAYNTAKTAGKINEKSRTAAAKKLLKKVRGKTNLDGYKPTESGIVLCNGEVAFMGDSIIGISEVFEKKTLNLAETFFSYPTEPAADTIDSSHIRSAYKSAKVEYKDYKGSKRLCELSDLALVMVHDKDGTAHYYQSELVISALDLVGTTGNPLAVELTTNNGRYPMMKFTGTQGTALVCAFARNREETYTFEAIYSRITDGKISDDILESAGFEHNDQWITNPTYDPTGRFSLSMDEAVKTYGEENVRTFLRKVLGRI